MPATLADKVAVAAVKAAKAIADKPAPTAPELALGRALFLGGYDARLELVCAALFLDTADTAQPTVDAHVSQAVAVMLALGLGGAVGEPLALEEP